MYMSPVIGGGAWFLSGLGILIIKWFFMYFYLINYFDMNYNDKYKGE